MFRHLYRSSSGLSIMVGIVTACSNATVDAPEPQAETALETGEVIDVEAEIARLEAKMAKLPGKLVITRSNGAELDTQTREALLDADNVIHVFSDDRVRAYTVSDTQVPKGVPPTRVFSELEGDIVLGHVVELPDHIAAQEPQMGPRLRPLGLRLRTGHGGLFPGGTVPFEIDGSFAGAELAALRTAIASWNGATSPSGEAIRARFVPRYPNDGRPYVRFVRVAGVSYCGRSAVGRHDTSLTNWWSHNIEIACVDAVTIQHEMGHTVGLHHEHQRCDRDQFVAVTGSGIDCDRICSADILNHGPFNYLSIMAYGYGACGLSEITPTSAAHRGWPWQLGTSTGLDPFDVAAINETYREQPALPQLGAGLYFLLLPEHAPGKGVIIGGHDRNNGTPAIQWTSMPWFWDQQWEIAPDGGGFFEIRNRNSGKCLEISGWTITEGASIGQWDCFGADHQKWTIAPSTASAGRFDIINKFSRRSMDIEAASTTDGARVVQWTHYGSMNQRFALERVF